MANNCGRIASGISRKCSTPLIGGVSDELILLNFSDVINYDENASNPQIIEGINMITSPAAKGYLFEGYKSSVGPKVSLVPNPYLSSWKHEVLFRIFDNTPETKAIIEGLKDGTFVAIVKNNNQGTNGNAVYELFGKGVGLELTTGDSDKNDQESQGAWVLTLSTPDNNQEPKLPASIYLTSLAITKAMVDSLL